MEIEMTLDELKSAFHAMNDAERKAFQKRFGGGPNNFTGRLEDVSFWIDDFVRNPQKESLYSREFGLPTEQERLNQAQIAASSATVDAATSAREANRHAEDANRLAQESNETAKRAASIAFWSLTVAIVSIIVALIAVFTPPFTQ